MEVRIRDAVPSDAYGIARVHVDSWRTTYAGIVPEQYLSSLSYSDRESWWGNAITNGRNFVLLAEVLGTGKTNNNRIIIGFASGGQNRSTMKEDSDYTGELYAIYLLEEYQGRSIGRQLTCSLVKKLVQSGHSSMLVWVLAKNPYRRFYEKLGGKYVRSQEVKIGGVSLEEVAYGWEDVNMILKKD